MYNALLIVGAMLHINLMKDRRSY